MAKSNYVNKVKHLLGTTCPECDKGTLKKKYNRIVKPAKPFLGCTNYPKCDYSLELDGSKPNLQVPDYFCSVCRRGYSATFIERKDMDNCVCGGGIVSFYDEGLSFHEHSPIALGQF